MADDAMGFLLFTAFHLLCLWQISSCQSFGDLGNLADIAGQLGSLFNAVDECEFTCKNGADPKPNPLHKMTSNGCGSYGLKIDLSSFPKVSDCCDKHDMCYDTCGEDKAVCDRKFKKCIEKICSRYKQSSKKKHKECKDISKLLYGGTAALGCDAFQSSQENACLCERENKKHFKKKSEL